MVRPAETGTRTILFTDVVDSTALRSELGDDAADELWHEHEELLRGAIERHDGRFAKGLGDGVMAVFDSAAGAVDCAVDMQRTLADQVRSGRVSMAIRIGLSAGDVREDDDDWFGTPVVEAARLQAAADPGQILVAEIVRILAGTRTTHRFGPTRDLELKGLRGALPACVLHWQDDGPADEVPRASGGATRRTRRTMPAWSAGLVGRDEDLLELEKLLLGPAGVVTLIGPGGVGKTRLAGAAAELAVAAGHFTDGVHFVELAAVGADQVVNAVATTLDVREAPGMDLETSVADDLCPRRLLLVLDNCEHVVESAAQLAHVLLEAAPELMILATSQVPLGTGDETVYSVAPLTVPAEDTDDPSVLQSSPAAQLFVDRARRANRSFEVTMRSASAIAQICRRLDGIPLAIELAAARSRALSPAQIVDRLDDRFRFLVTGSRTAAERHQTLVAAVGWSYSLLSEPERRVLARVSRFPGGFDLAVAERVASDDLVDGIRPDEVFDVLATLVDRSLVTVVDGGGDEVRYRLLETIRSYAIHQLDDPDFERTSEEMLRWAVELAQSVEEEIDGPGEDEAFARLSQEQENLIVAIKLAEEAAEAGAAMTIAAVLAVWLDIVGHFGEGIAMCEDVLGWSTDVDPIAERRLLLRAGNLALSSGRLDRAHTFYEESLERAQQQGDEQGVLSAINNLSITAMWQGNFKLARSLLDQAAVSVEVAPASWVIFQVTKAELALYLNVLQDVVDLIDSVTPHYGEVGSYTIAEAEVLRATALFASGRSDEAGSRFEVALEHAESAEAIEFMALARHGLGLVAMADGELDSARGHLDTALADARVAGHSRAIAMLLASLGELERRTGHLDRAAGRHRESLDLRLKMGDRYGVAQSLEARARVLVEDGRSEDAIRWLAVASVLREVTGGARWPIEQAQVEHELAQLRARIADFDVIWSDVSAGATAATSLDTLVGELP